MKLRIKGNSLRFRLTQTEVLQLTNDGTVSETVAFGNFGAQFVYTLATDAGAKAISAEFNNGELTVRVPIKIAKDWGSSEIVSINADNISPTVLVEKDFACLKPRTGEDETDMFPNPAGSGCSPF